LLQVVSRILRGDRLVTIKTGPDNPSIVISAPSSWVALGPCVYLEGEQKMEFIEEEFRGEGIIARGTTRTAALLPFWYRRIGRAGKPRNSASGVVAAVYDRRKK
jgi:hypothetical protein